jgi:uncharacterized protein (DUF427 family)
MMRGKRFKRVEPGPGQESVWDYPRPPALDPSARHVVVRLPSTGEEDGVVLVDTRRAVRVLETSHPPTWYVPREDVTEALLRRSQHAGTTCEFKGRATYWDVVLPGGGVLAGVAWSYEQPTPAFAAITGHLSMGAGVLECTVGGERARPQEGGFYAGWITDDVVGPFKGAPGTWGW